VAFPCVSIPRIGGRGPHFNESNLEAFSSRTQSAQEWAAEKARSPAPPILWHRKPASARNQPSPHRGNKFRLQGRGAISRAQVGPSSPRAIRIGLPGAHLPTGPSYRGQISPAPRGPDSTREPVKRKAL